jgi:hypothetical protein
MQNIASCKRDVRDIWCFDAARKSVKEKWMDNSTSAEDRGPENIRIPASLIELLTKYGSRYDLLGTDHPDRGVAGRMLFANLPGIDGGCHPRQKSFRVSVIPWAGACQAL